MERTTETATQDPFGTAPSTPDEDLLSATGNDQYEAPVTGMPTGEPVAEGTPAFASEKLQPEAEFHPDPEQQSRPWGMPVPGPSPTAEGMTARGEVLLSEGKLQEAIDQFTKAIALNPKHREAFERRAEAYSRQGRQERADEDYRQFQALNTGS
jgi:tetratricopeptide (TPR) repeat protein